MGQEKFKVLLIHANSTLDTLIPPNLAIMSAFLKKAGHEVKLFDTTFYKTRKFTGGEARENTLQVKKTNLEDVGVSLKITNMYDDFLKEIKRYKPNIVGLSAVSLTYPFGIEFLRKLRQSNLEDTLTNEKIPTIVGGIHATVSPTEVLKEDCVDYVCVGEGDEALIELVNSLKNKKDTTNIKNIWTKKNGQIIKNSVRPPVNINELPFQDWDIFDERRIFKPMGDRIWRVGCFELDRGCPYSCSYCSNDFWHKLYDHKNYRKKDVGKFVEEVKHMKEKYNLEYIYLASETFLASSKDRFEEFVKTWKDEIKLPFWCQTRPETVTEERIRILKELGMHSIGVGVESGSYEIRQMLNRKMTNDTIINAFDIFSRVGVKSGANVIVGFPGETRKQIFETINLIKTINPNNVMTHVFNPYRGTPLYDVCVEKEYIDKNEMGGDYRQDFVLNMPQISKEEILGLQRTFALYSRFPEERWPEIRIAERFDKKGNRKFNELKKEYTEKFLK